MNQTERDALIMALFDWRKVLRGRLARDGRKLETLTFLEHLNVANEGVWCWQGLPLVAQ